MGKHKYIETPEKLLEHFVNYIADTKSTPKYENIVLQKTGEIISVPRERPISFIGFENWLYNKGIISQLTDYESDNPSYAEYLTIITRIKKFIYEDKADGATVGIYNPNIIARELGLKEQTETEITVAEKPKMKLPDGTEIEI